MSTTPEDACSVESNHGAQQAVNDSTGFYFSLLDSLRNTGNLVFDELIYNELLEYFLFDVRCQAIQINVQLEAGYDADDEEESQLHTLLMSAGEKVVDFLDRVFILRATLVALGEIVEDKMIIPITLCALPSKFQTFVTTLNITKQQSQIQSSPSVPPIKSSTQWYFICNAPTHDTDRCWYNGLTQGASSKEGTSSHSHSRSSRGQRHQQGNVATHQDDIFDGTSNEDTYALAPTSVVHPNLVLVSQTSPSSRDVWLIDSGASKHMTGDKGLFDTLNSTPTGDLIRIADDKEYVAKGIGTITIPLTEGSCSLSNVLYVPGFTSNLLSVSQHVNHRVKVEFQV
ncbi:uncharacterized protein LOC131873929 [Cryptomeria japonica]|uniref:uncharacterized protein LOC131873929 n=1 Tax=Cryptomeria japonica TaxID=3369 RepID=UPI0027DA47DA|nr:uncharacterized protein LOC131873929 [Cryptomeria japonica]